jgi:hypothetical protein
MPAKKYVVTLAAEERGRLTGLVSAGRRLARTITRARILLLADASGGGPGWLAFGSSCRAPSGTTRPQAIWPAGCRSTTMTGSGSRHGRTPSECCCAVEVARLH